MKYFPSGQMLLKISIGMKWKRYLSTRTKKPGQNDFTMEKTLQRKDSKSFMKQKAIIKLSL